MDRIIKDIIEQIIIQIPTRTEGVVKDSGVDRKGIYEVAISQEDIDKLRESVDG